MAKKVLTQNLSVPLNGASAARFDIHVGDGNLTIAGLPGSEQVLASGTLEYLVTQQIPAQELVSNSRFTALTLRGGQSKQPRFRMPWSACNGATNWFIQFNPEVSSEIAARSDGGNLKLDLQEMRVTGLSADTGGGNITLVLPDGFAYLSVNARTGAGNVEVSLPSSLAARIHATTGLGRLVMDPHLEQIDKATYQSPGYETASEKVEITASSGAGNVSVTFR